MKLANFYPDKVAFVLDEPITRTEFEAWCARSGAPQPWKSADYVMSVFLPRDHHDIVLSFMEAFGAPTQVYETWEEYEDARRRLNPTAYAFIDRVRARKAVDA